MLVFLFTDIEGSSWLWEEHSGVMSSAITRHDVILREQVEGCGGRITKHTGDGFTAVFQSTGQPLACALEPQKRFAAEPWGEIGELRIRVPEVPAPGGVPGGAVAPHGCRFLFDGTTTDAIREQHSNWLAALAELDGHGVAA
jgi:hypothetical protein